MKDTPVVFFFVEGEELNVSIMSDAIPAEGEVLTIQLHADQRERRYKVHSREWSIKTLLSSLQYRVFVNLVELAPKAPEVDDAPLGTQFGSQW